VESRVRENFTHGLVGEVMPMRKLFKRRGFTLIELLVVVAIIGILVSTLLPALSKAKAHAKTIACSNNEKHFGIAINMYCDDNFNYYQDNYAPSIGGFGYWQKFSFLGPYLKPDLETGYNVDYYFPCPSASPNEVYYSNHWYYAMHGSLRLQKRSMIKRPAARGIFLDSQQRKFFTSLIYLDGVTDPGQSAVYRHNNGLNLLFADGHVEYYRRDDLLANRLTLFDFTN
jgi:prepilin-type N-terminal cleavage/methylation domain-containing protein/prepilin-type processing-associated H-X9-DG protein